MSKLRYCKWKISVRHFWPSALTLTSQKLTVTFGQMLSIRVEFHDNLTFTFREITTNSTKERTNKRTNQRSNNPQTRPITTPPGRGKSMSTRECIVLCLEDRIYEPLLFVYEQVRVVLVRPARNGLGPARVIVVCFKLYITLQHTDRPPHAYISHVHNICSEKTRTSKPLNHRPCTPYSHFWTCPPFQPQDDVLKILWWYLERFRSCHVDRQTDIQTHKRTLLKIIPPSLRGC